MKIKDLVKLEKVKKEREYTANAKETTGCYSHTKGGERYFDIEYNQGYNQAIDTIGEKTVEFDIDNLEALGITWVLKREQTSSTNKQIFCVLFRELAKEISKNLSELLKGDACQPHSKPE